MFIPLTDHIRRQTFWFVTLVLILANVLVFLFELSLGPSLNRFVYVFGIVPARYTVPYFLRRTPLDGLLFPLFVSMFLHGGWLHLLGNMLFLFVFGRSVGRPVWSYAISGDVSGMWIGGRRNPHLFHRGVEGADHWRQRVYRGSARRLFRQLPARADHNSDLGDLLLLDGTDSRRDRSGILVLPAVRDGVSDVNHSNRRIRRSSMVGARWGFSHRHPRGVARTHTASPPGGQHHSLVSYPTDKRNLVFFPPKS